MTNSELEQIVNRLETVEKQNRKIKTTFLFFTLISIVCFSLFLFVSNENRAYAIESETIPDVIKAKKFVVVDDEGEEMVIINNSKYGGLMFIINKDGKPTAGFVNVKNGGVISLYNKVGKETAIIRNGEYGGMLSIFNKTGEEIVRLLANEYGNGVVGAYNRKGEGNTLTPNP